MNKDDLETYEKAFKTIDNSKISPWYKYESDSIREIISQERVFEILSKYTSEIKRNVVLWGRKKDKVVEIDFVAEINGYVVICDVKGWFGKISLSSEKEKVLVSCINLNGEYIERVRTSPIYSIASFTSDLRDYLKPNAPKQNTQVFRYIVFTRDDIEFDISLKNYNTSIKMLTLKGLEEILKEISNKMNEKPYHIEKQLPSWDIYFNKYDNKWFKCAIISKSMETSLGTIEISSIDSILLADEIGGTSIIKMRDGRILEAVVDKRTIKVNTTKHFATSYFKYIKFNQILHKE